MRTFTVKLLLQAQGERTASTAELGSKQALSTLSFSDGPIEFKIKPTCIRCLFRVIPLYNIAEANVFYDET